MEERQQQESTVSVARLSLAARRGVQVDRLSSMESKCSIEEDDAYSVILPFLLISRIGDAFLEDVQGTAEMNIGCIIDCSGTSRNKEWKKCCISEGMRVLTVELEDTPSTDLTEAFHLTFEAVEHCRTNGTKCIVACQHGMSRSVSLVLAYLMTHPKMTLLQALEHVRQCRPIASPNHGFMRQLLALEQTLHRKTAPSLDLTKYKEDRFADISTLALSKKTPPFENTPTFIDLFMSIPSPFLQCGASESSQQSMFHYR
eukprot:15351798-Ditylum_brightwellii.AAC.1